MLIKKLLPLLIAVFTFSFAGIAQVTTSSMSGFVKSAQGEALAGATVTVTNEATGSVVRTVTKSGGRYDFNNLAPGGPYSVSVSFVNFATEKREDIHLTLGENSKQD